MKLCGERFLFERLYLFRKNKKNAVKISFLAVPEFGLAIKNYTLTGLTAVIKRGPDEFQYDALKLVEKTFVLEVESFSITQFEKCFYIFFPEKEKKSNFWSNRP